MLCSFLLYKAIHYILFHYSLSQDIKYNSPHYTARPVVYPFYTHEFASTNPKLPILAPRLPSSSNHKSVLYICESVFFSLGSFVSYFTFHI